MGTTSSIPSSLLPGTATFNGTSTFAGDLQQAINHAVTVASIPLTELQSNLGTLQAQTSEISTLQTDFAAVQTAIQNLSSVSGKLFCGNHRGPDRGFRRIGFERPSDGGHI